MSPSFILRTWPSTLSPQKLHVSPHKELPSWIPTYPLPRPLWPWFSDFEGEMWENIVPSIVHAHNSMIHPKMMVSKLGSYSNPCSTSIYAYATNHVRQSPNNQRWWVCIPSHGKYTPRKLMWNLKIIHFERNFIFQTFIHFGVPCWFLGVHLFCDKVSSLFLE